ncbi:putative Polysaccharide biosynthesis protein [Vibrio harveyi]|uniref:lipopolysaccharide biosynthesis protein n=1 Tax=Vibrio harveyi TaxID=669 RepID=UPI001EFC8BD0|nr:oligosaccharide flippase family protein [Vibrio harveyi]MCG9233345.1 oligosaccharide flippase family protein [Vibrio harveyi]MCG9587377.1 oligosaccharide flippase family protein [Vibrio harveyi]CAH1235588.1 putative Polysaccharide biosynthesis protein [Vibrio harveyi]CAH1580366.1 putative Polysaccharide biosynthesis protein [Vibrio harveyi]CAH1589121.1 putative Polysaccharide biosynthesis protein [Vibrio harveyi]
MGVYKNIAANFTGIIITTILTFLVVPYYLEWLGSESYGLVGFATLIQNWLMIISSGFNPVAGRAAARAQEGHEDWKRTYTLIRSIDFSILSIGFGLVLVLFLLPNTVFSNWFQADKIDSGDLAIAILLLVVIAILRLASAIGRGVIANLEMQIWLNINLSCCSFLRFALSLPVVYYYNNMLSLFYWWFFVSALEYISIQYKIRKSTPMKASFFSFSFDELRKHGKFAATLSFTSLVWIAITQLDKLIFTKTMSLENYGIFSVAVLLSGGVLLLSQPLTQAYQPKLIKIFATDGSKGLGQEVVKVTRLTLIALLPITVIFSFNAEDVILLWTSNKNVAEVSAVFLPGYTIGNYFAALLGVLYLVQVAIGNISLHFKGNIIFAFLLIPSVIYLAFMKNAYYVSWFWSLANGIMLIFWGDFVLRRILPNLKFKWVVFEVLMPSILLMTLYYFLLQDFSVFITDISRLDLLLNLLIKYFIVLCICVVLLAIFKKDKYND